MITAVYESISRGSKRNDVATTTFVRKIACRDVKTTERTEAMVNKKEKTATVAVTTGQPLSEDIRTNSAIIADKKPKSKTLLETYDGKTLMELDLPTTNFLIDNLIGKGLYILAGSPKVGKSWLALSLTIDVAKGNAIWGNKVNGGRTVYLCLEDNRERIQNRLLYITDDAPENSHFCISAGILNKGLENELEDFILKYSDTTLIIIDTLQMVRNSSSDVSYASDYGDLTILKKLADKYHLTILLIHHLRKDSSDDKFNRISGTTGLQGACDGMILLEESERGSGKGTLTVTGRDVPYRTLTIQKNKRNIWELVSDSLENHLHPIVDLLKKVMSGRESLELSPTEFVERYSSQSDIPLSTRTIRKLINSQKTSLQSIGINYSQHRTGENNLIVLSKSVLQSDDNDSN